MGREEGRGEEGNRKRERRQERGGRECSVTRQGRAGGKEIARRAEGEVGREETRNAEQSGGVRLVFTREKH